LVDEGRLSLEDTLESLGFDVPGGEKITEKMLLNHTSGLFDYVADFDFSEVLKSDPAKHYTPQQMVDIGTAHDSLFEPGEDYAYSNTNYILLGMIIENVTSASYEDEVERRITDKLGMENTFFPTGVEIPGAHAHGYSDVNGDLEDVTVRDTSVAWAAGALVSTLEDLRIWAAALAGGELLSEETFEQQTKMVDEPGSVTGEKMGLGIVARGSYLGFSGAIPGYRTEMFNDPEKGTTVINLFNELSLNDHQLVERSAYYDAFVEMSTAVGDW
jgi:D-alanyl-D-alanine carboxypeptidase